MGQSPKCHIPSFIAIGLFVLEKKILKDFTIYGHLGHVTQIPRTNFRTPGPQKFHVNLALMGPVVSEEKMFEKVVGRTTDAWLYYKLAYQHKGLGGLKKTQQKMKFDPIYVSNFAS